MKKPAVPGSSAFKGKRPGEFVKETWVEITTKTTWPTRPELVKATTVVLVAIIMIAAYMAAWDFVLSRITQLLFLR
jgi:preprotein translocase SecE subunit